MTGIQSLIEKIDFIVLIYKCFFDIFFLFQEENIRCFLSPHINTCIV